MIAGIRAALHLSDTRQGYKNGYKTKSAQAENALEQKVSLR